ncbi:MAG: methyltransferase domain-containing protein [Chitinophagales bacterium]|nr:methyltransferase domain-containing protein [Chitinophagales bacterium]
MARNLDQYSDSYRNHPFEIIQARYRKKCVIESIMKYPHRTVVEVGCGSDSLVNHFTDFDRWFIIEPASLFFQQAVHDIDKNTRIKEKVLIVNGMVEEVRELPFIPDMIIVSGLLHEIEKPESLLLRLSNLCALHTVIHFNVPNAKSFHRLLAKEAGLIKDLHEISASQISLQQHHTYDIESLSHLVNEYGFNVIDNGSYFFKPFTHKQMQQLVDIKLIDDNMLEGFYLITKYFPENGSEFFLNCKKSN